MTRDLSYFDSSLVWCESIFHISPEASADERNAVQCEIISGYYAHIKAIILHNTLK